MGILDEAIREHLELKRQHGAGDSELKKIEDEAFGPADRPGGEAPSDALAEAPTEFLAQPEPAEEEADGAQDEERSTRREAPSVADLQEPPEPPAAEPEPPPAAPEPSVEEPESEPTSAGHSTEEREAIAEQPTELYDVEDELAAAAPSPSDEELLEEEIAEPRLAPSDPLAGLEEGEEAEVVVEGPAPAEDEDEDDEFWNEQRLSDELDQALEAPLEDEPQPLADEHEAQEPEPSAEHEVEAPAPGRDEDVLEETPDFLEETPEDDELWFEQKPPKDFDFDD
jgi:hypothetical protein